MAVVCECARPVTAVLAVLITTGKTCRYGYDGNEGAHRARKNASRTPWSQTAPKGALPKKSPVAKDFLESSEGTKQCQSQMDRDGLFNPVGWDCCCW